MRKFVVSVLFLLGLKNIRAQEQCDSWYAQQMGMTQDQYQKIQDDFDVTEAESVQRAQNVEAMEKFRRENPTLNINAPKKGTKR